MSAPENPAAFPSEESHPSYDMPMHHSGMSLRDWFAGQATLPAIGLAEQQCKASPMTLAATLAYEFADAMLAERAKVQP